MIGVLKMFVLSSVVKSMVFVGCRRCADCCSASQTVFSVSVSEFVFFFLCVCDLKVSQPEPFV